MRWGIGRGQTAQGCAWWWCSEPFIWARGVLGCFNALLHPASHTDPVKSLFSGLTDLGGFCFLAKAAAVKLTCHTLASGNVLMVKLIHVLPRPLAKRPNEEK